LPRENGRYSRTSPRPCCSIFRGRDWLADLSIPAWFALMSLWLFAVMMLSAFALVWYAECLAEKRGERFGTLIRTLAITGIEVMMIAAVMHAGKGYVLAMGFSTGQTIVLDGGQTRGVY